MLYDKYFLHYFVATLLIMVVAAVVGFLVGLATA